MAYAPGPHAPRRTGPAPPRRTEPATRAPSPASPPPPRRSAHSAVRPPPSAAPAPAAPRDTPPSSTAPAPPTSPADPARSAKHRQLDSSNKPTANTAVYLADTPLAAAGCAPRPDGSWWRGRSRPPPHRHWGAVGTLDRDQPSARVRADPRSHRSPPDTARRRRA